MDKTRADCAGCRNDFYNARGGCWNFADATVERRVHIHRDWSPPYKGIRPQRTLSCWYGENGMRAYLPETFTADGYWK